MTPLEHAQLRSEAAGFIADALELGVSTLTKERAVAFTQLFAELDRLRAENTRLHAQLDVLLGDGPLA